MHGPRVGFARLGGNRRGRRRPQRSAGVRRRNRLALTLDPHRRRNDDGRTTALEPAKNRTTLAVVAALLAAVAVAAFLTGRALATGAPTQTPLTYAGTVTDEAGKPYAQAVDVQLKLYDKADAAVAKCTAPTVKAEAGSGRFAVVLPNECAQAVHAASDLWVEATVGARVLPKAHVGAVPYALESASASQSQQALDLKCVGCVGVAKMAFDQDVDLKGHKLTTGPGGAVLEAGEFDLGAVAGDELTSAHVKTLTGGGNADALHTHAGGPGGGGRSSSRA